MRDTGLQIRAPTRTNAFEVDLVCAVLLGLIWLVKEANGPLKALGLIGCLGYGLE